MKPIRIILVRHGQSIGNIDKNFYKSIPDYALELTPSGFQQAVDAGKELKQIIGEESTKFYISPYWRTRQTYQGIIKSFPEVLKRTPENFYEDPRLREQEWSGGLRKGNYEDIEQERDGFGRFYYRIDGGESCADIFDRISGFLDTLNRDFLKKNFPSNCIIITHGLTLRVFLMRFFHMSVEEFESLRNPKNCQIVVLELDNAKYKLVSKLEKYEKSTHEYQYDWNKCK